MDKREGRGRLSSIELLPSEADEVVAWAATELVDRSRTADDIHVEFNEKLAEIGLGPISRSAFHRYSIRQSALARRREVTREIVAAINAKLNVKDMDELSIVLGDTLKMIVFETLERGAEKGFTPKQAMEMASAFKSIVTAEAVPAKHRRKVEEEFEQSVNTAVEEAGKEAGLSKDQVEQIKRDVLGVRPKAAQE